MENKANIEQVIGQVLLNKNLTLSLAESCTGGLVSSRLTDISGSSAYIKLNLVTYSNEAKVKMLGVGADTIEQYGAVSEPVALQMAQGVRKLAETDIGVGVTGIAGPIGGSPQKPVGLVYIGIADNNTSQVHRVNIDSGLSRKKVKYQASELVLEFLNSFIKE